MAIISGKTNLTTDSAANVIAAQSAGTSLVVTSVAIGNAHETVGTKVDIRDGTTAKVTLYVAPKSTVTYAPGKPIFKGTAATAVTAKAATSGSDLDVNVTAYSDDGSWEALCI